MDSPSRADDQESSGGWMEDVGIISVQRNNNYGLGPAKYQGTPSYPLHNAMYAPPYTTIQASPSVYWTPAQTPTVQAASTPSAASYYPTPAAPSAPRIPPYSPAPPPPPPPPPPAPARAPPPPPSPPPPPPPPPSDDQAEGGAPGHIQMIPLPHVAETGHIVADAGPGGMPHTEHAGLASVAPAQRQRTLSNLSNMNTYPPSGFQRSRPSSLRQSSLDSNAQGTRTTRNVHFMDPDSEDEAPGASSRGLSTVTDSPFQVPISTELSSDDNPGTQTVGDVDFPHQPRVSTTHASSDEPDSPGSNNDGISMVAGRGPADSTKNRTNGSPAVSHLQTLRQKIVAIVGKGNAGRSAALGAVVPPSPYTVQIHGTYPPSIAGDAAPMTWTTQAANTSIQPTTAPPPTPEPVESVPQNAHTTAPTASVSEFAMASNPLFIFEAGLGALRVEPQAQYLGAPASVEGFMPSIQSNASVRPNGELSSSATASPHGILYSNGAAATGFAIGTPYQPYLPSGSYRWYPQAAWYPHAGLPQVRALHVGEGSVPLGVVLAYRGSHCRRMFFDPQWDDAQLLTEMRKTYDKLRSWRRWCSLKNVRSITLVKLSQDTFVFPQRIGPTKVSTRQHMRLRFLLDHPEALLGRRDFTTALMTRPDIGIEFVERWQATRLTIAVVGLVCFSLIVSLLYAWITKDVSTAFTIGAYITSAFSIILVLIGVLGFVDL